VWGEVNKPYAAWAHPFLSYQDLRDRGRITDFEELEDPGLIAEAAK